MSNPEFIAGIYNYCDYWCERCSFTSRCRNYEPPDDIPPEERDINNEAFWNKLSHSLETANELIREHATRMGIDLDAAMKEAEEDGYLERREALHTSVHQHPLTRLWKTYLDHTVAFVKSNDALENKVKTENEILHLGIGKTEIIQGEINNMEEYFRVIQWYMYFIGPKIQRALHGLLDSDDEDESGDADGSAKIAMVAIERSMSAWFELFNALPECEDTALESLSLLQQLQLNTKELFPQAMEFKRPGFDD